MQYESMDTEYKSYTVPEGTLYEWTVLSGEVRDQRDGTPYVNLKLQCTDQSLALDKSYGFHTLRFGKDNSKVWAARFLKAAKPELKVFDETDRNDLGRLASQLVDKKVMCRVVHETVEGKKYVHYRFVEFAPAKPKQAPAPSHNEFAADDEIPF